MAQQIKKKFIGPDQIDGSKIKLLENQSIRGINSLGQEVDLVKINAQDKVEVLGGEVALKSELDQEIVDRQSGDSALDARVKPIEDLLDFEKAIVYENNTPVIADGQPGVEDESLRPGWYYENMASGQKINWYFFDGVNQANIEKQDFSAYAVVTFDSVASLPILAVYTMPTGTNDVMPGFAHSRYIYSTFPQTPVVGKKYLLHVGQDPAIHPELPRLQVNLTTSQGDQSPTERVFTASFGTNSGAAVGNVKLVVEHLGVSSQSYKGNAELKIRPASLKKLEDEIASRESADSALQQNITDLEGVVQGNFDLQQSDINLLRSDVDANSSAISSEQTAREAADANLQSQIDSLNGNFATDQELSDAVGQLEGLISAETLARETADLALDQKIETEKARIDAILEASDADKDSFKEIVDLINSVDTENDQAFAGYVLSNDEAVAALDSRVDALEAFGYEQVIHVSKNGLDTNSGKQHSPFLTITAAMNAITDASPTKRYAVKVAAGAYSGPIALKANVFIIGEGQKESVRITGAVSMDSSFSGTADHRSGFSGVTLLSAADFNWATVTSGAGKLYFNEVVFGSTVNMYGHNNAIAQAQFNACIIFGALTISGINVGVFSNNVCYGNINLTQHPNGGMATILVASGGYCQGTITQTAPINDFNRRAASFLRNFNSEKIVLDGPSVYADVDLISQGKQLPEISNGANLIALNPTINHDITAQMIVPKNTNAHNMGDWGKQWFWNFGYVHASSGTDLFLVSYPESYAPDSSGKSIGIYTDGAGLQENVDGGDIELQTAATSGTGVRGKITLDGKEIDVTSKQIKNLADATDASDAVNKSQLDSIVQFNKETKVVDSTILSNEYVDLAFLAKPNSIVMFVGRLAMIEGSDYSVSVVEGVTRVTFLAPMLVPSEEALELDDVIHFTYAK
jgi:hypothetical protein